MFTLIALLTTITMVAIPVLLLILIIRAIKKKSIKKIGMFLAVCVMFVIFLSFLGGAFSDAEEIRNKHDTLQVQYDELFANYKDLYERYEGEIEDELSIPVVVSTMAKQIDKNAVVTVFDEKVVHIMVSYATDIKNRVEEYVGLIPSTLGTYEYESCIISVVDDTGKCVYGWTIWEKGEIDTFVSESFITK